MTGTREPARSSSATASMFPGVKCPARRCSIPAKGATVASAKDPSPLRYWSRRLHQGIKWRHHPHQVNYNSTATADITLSVLEEQKSPKTGLPFLCLPLTCLMPVISADFQLGDASVFHSERLMALCSQLILPSHCKIDQIWICFQICWKRHGRKIWQTWDKYDL